MQKNTVHPHTFRIRELCVKALSQGLATRAAIVKFIEENSSEERIPKQVSYALLFFREEGVVKFDGKNYQLQSERWEKLKQKMEVFAGKPNPDKKSQGLERPPQKRDYKCLSEDAINLADAFIRELAKTKELPKILDTSQYTKISGLVNKGKELMRKARDLEEREIKHKTSLEQTLN